MDKLSFIGDLMFERQYIKSRQTKTGYDFSGLLINLRPLLCDSCLVIANLESVFAGSECKYTASLYSFNTPTEALDVLKECNISVVTTANNHCLDRGIKGIQKTIQALDQRRILHTGTYIDPNETDRSLIREINGVRYAFMSYTYGTNSLENKILLNQSELGHINLLKPQENDKLAQTEKQPSAFRKILNTLSQKLFSSEARMRIKKTLGMTLNVPIVDDNLKLDYNFLDKLRQDIKKTKSESDVQFMCLHCGGQFNAYPGNFTKEIVKVLHQEGIHYIIATHPHVVQLCSVDNCGNITFYSIGNLTISPSSIYVLHELKPEYSIIPHFYFDKDIHGNSVLKRLTFSIVKVVEGVENSLTVFPISRLWEQSSEDERENLLYDVRFIYNRVTNSNTNIAEIQDEYEIGLKQI